MEMNDISLEYGLEELYILSKYIYRYIIVKFISVILQLFKYKIFPSKFMTYKSLFSVKFEQ